MSTARAILASAVLVALAIIGSAWFIAEQGTATNRYQLVNAGGGLSVRLDRQTGDLMGCRRVECFKMAEGDKVLKVQDEWPGHVVPPVSPAGAATDD